MHLKKIFLLSILAIHVFVSFGQQVITATSDKAEYKMNEPINIVFEANVYVDSIGKLAFNNFIKTDGPYSSRSSSTVNGKSTGHYKIGYEIKAKQPGKYRIESPVFYINGEQYKANPITVSISAESLTKEEQRQIGLKKFRDEMFKPEGTTRYVLDDNYGYIEIFTGADWKFLRELTNKERKKLMKKK